jgi:hypothetical protein
VNEVLSEGVCLWIYFLFFVVYYTAQVTFFTDVSNKLFEKIVFFIVDVSVLMIVVNDTLVVVTLNLILIKVKKIALLMVFKKNSFGALFLVVLVRLDFEVHGWLLQVNRRHLPSALERILKHLTVLFDQV